MQAALLLSHFELSSCLLNIVKYAVSFHRSSIARFRIPFIPLISAEYLMLDFLSTDSFVGQIITSNWLPYYLRRWFGKALVGHEKINCIHLMQPISSSTSYIKWWKYDFMLILFSLIWSFILNIILNLSGKQHRNCISVKKKKYSDLAENMCSPLTENASYF